MSHGSSRTVYWNSRGFINIVVAWLIMTHDEFLHGLENETEEYVEPKWKKPVIFALGIFLIILILGYYLVVSDALIGIINSKTVKNNVLQSDGMTIVFENNTLEILQQEYLAHQGREIKACLFGEIDDKYHVKSISFPKVLSASVVHINTPGCPIDAIIDLHSHPINRCVPSGQDFRNFGIRKQSTPELLMMVMCWKNRFALEI